jgi:hypothetical protein
LTDSMVPRSCEISVYGPITHATTRRESTDLYPRLDFPNLELPRRQLVPHAPLLQVQVEPDAGGRLADLLAQALLELLDVGEQPLVLGPQEGVVLLFDQGHFRFELCMRVRSVRTRWRRLPWQSRPGRRVNDGQERGSTNATFCVY